MLIATTAMLTSCKQTPKEMLTGEYKISDITTDRKMSPDDAKAYNDTMEEYKKNTVLILNGDGTLQQTLNGVTTKGTWEILGDDVEDGESWRLKLIMEDKSTVNMQIIELSNSGFIYIEPDKETHSTTTIIYTKVK